jgi:hypothetical protein
MGQGHMSAKPNMRLFDPSGLSRGAHIFMIAVFLTTWADSDANCQGKKRKLKTGPNTANQWGEARCGGQGAAGHPMHFLGYFWISCSMKRDRHGQISH